MTPKPVPLREGLWLASAILTFIALGWLQSETFMVWSEETMVHSAPAQVTIARDLDAEGRLQFEHSCNSPQAPLLHFSSGRPRLTMCAFDRAWPVAIAPYLGGVAYWPAALLMPLHQGNVLVLRKMALGMAALSILLTWLVVRRLWGPSVAMLVAWCTAVCPIFVASHSILVHFETSPWLWLMAGVAPLLRSGSSDDGSRAQAFPTMTLVWAGFCVGWSVASNLKSTWVIVPLALVAWRMGFSVRRISLKQWAWSLAAMAAPMAPLAATLLAPDDDYGDRASQWQSALLRNLAYPERVVPFTRDLLLYWSNTAAYLAPETAGPFLNPAALAVATVALVFVVVDATRTLWRGHGDVLAACVGACIAVHLVMATLVYESFPVNFTLLHTLFAAAVAVTLHRAVAWSATRALAGWSRALTVVVLLVFTASSLLSIRFMRDLPVPTNAFALKQLAQWMNEHQEPDTLHVNTEEMLMGVIESLTGETLSTIRSQLFLKSCHLDRDETAACLIDRFRLLLETYPERAIRFVVTVNSEVLGGDDVELTPFLSRAAELAGRQVSVEQAFWTPAGDEVLRVLRVTTLTDAS